MIETTTTRVRDALEPSILDGHRVLLGDLVLDLAERTISSPRGRIVKLSSNEFVVLATLIKTPGRFVDRDALLQAMRVPEASSSPAVVDTYVKYLRRQILDARSAATLETSPSRGVRLLP